MKYIVLVRMKKTVCKVKGIRINYETSRIINFEKMKEIVLRNSNNVGNSLSILTRNILRPKDFEVVSSASYKNYKPCLEKRRFNDKYGSVPYGYKRLRTE